MDVTSLTPGIKVAKDGGEVGDNSDDKASDVYEYEGDQVFYTDPSTKGKSPDAKLHLRYSLGTRENTLTFLRLGWHVMIRLLLHLFIHNYEFLHIMLHIMLTSLWFLASVRYRWDTEKNGWSSEDGGTTLAPAPDPAQPQYEFDGTTYIHRDAQGKKFKWNAETSAWDEAEVQIKHCDLNHMRKIRIRYTCCGVGYGNSYRYSSLSVV